MQRFYILLFVALLSLLQSTSMYGMDMIKHMDADENIIKQDPQKIQEYLQSNLKLKVTPEGNYTCSAPTPKEASLIYNRLIAMNGYLNRQIQEQQLDLYKETVKEEIKNQETNNNKPVYSKTTFGSLALVAIIGCLATYFGLKSKNPSFTVCGSAIVGSSIGAFGGFWRGFYHARTQSNLKSRFESNLKNLEERNNNTLDMLTKAQIVVNQRSKLKRIVEDI